MRLSPRLATRMDRVVVFTADLNFTVCHSVVSLLERHRDLEVFIALHKPPKPLARLMRNQWLNVKKNGWRWIPYQTRDIVARVSGRLRPASPVHSPRPGEKYTLQAIERHPRVRIEAFDTINGDAAVVAILQFAPDLGLSLAAPILKAETFSIPKFGTINLHKGKVPEYRGMPPAFWELWNGESSVGCTVHYVDDGLDTGAIIVEGRVERQPFSTVAGLRVALDQLGVQLVDRAVNLIGSDTAQPKRQQGNGKTHRKPTLAQVASLEEKLAPPGHSSPARDLARTLASIGYTHGLRPLSRWRNRLLRKTEIVVLLYHRVSDEFRDGVTVGIEQFDAQMEYIASRYPLISIDDVVKGKVPATGNGKPWIAVTFDDGYLDNYENAVPILLRHRVPTAFFVSTGMMGTDRGFRHDLDKLGHALPNMNWEQLREMQALGFTIGSHTVTHLNCASADPTDLRRELIESKQALERELGLDEVMFAYPFGGRSDMTSQALDAVKEIGYTACLSAYGGVNRGAIDPFNVLRMGVSCGFQPSRFAARVEGW